MDGLGALLKTTISCVGTAFCRAMEEKAERDLFSQDLEARILLLGWPISQGLFELLGIVTMIVRDGRKAEEGTRRLNAQNEDRG